ncbi:MAG: helix-hairpin-helix domain-containing protein [Chloroflexota bacterium]
MQAWLRGNWSGLGVGLFIAALVLMLSWFWRVPPTPITISIPTLAPSPTSMVVVHVAGGVRDPGVYTFPSNARIADALERAGGVVENGDSSALNLAARMVDGQRILVPLQGEVRTTATGSLVSLNRASRAELESLPGIGPTTAQRILEFRERNGAFHSLDQLREQRIVPAQTLDRLRDLVRLD